MRSSTLTTSYRANMLRLGKLVSKHDGVNHSGHHSLATTRRLKANDSVNSNSTNGAARNFS